MGLGRGRKENAIMRKLQKKKRKTVNAGNNGNEKGR